MGRCPACDSHTSKANKTTPHGCSLQGLTKVLLGENKFLARSLETKRKSQAYNITGKQWDTYAHQRGFFYLVSQKNYLPIKKNEIMSLAVTGVDLEMIILGEVSQTEEDKYRMIPFAC